MAIVLPRPAMLVLNAGSSSLKFTVFAAATSLDPSVHGLVDGIGVEPRLYLEQARGMTADEVTTLLYTKSGLLGLSGALAVSLRGLDALVFTAGIGEHAAPVRAAVCERLAWLGVAVDPAANERHGPRISTAASAVSAWVIPTDEERMIARHVLRLACA